MSKPKNIFRKITAALLAAVMTVSLAACGSRGEQTGTDKTEEEGYVWVASYMTLTDGQDTDISGMEVIDNRLYFSYTAYGDSYKKELRYLDLENPEAEPVTVFDFGTTESEEGYMSNIAQAVMCRDGGIAVVSSRIPLFTAEAATTEDYERQMAETTYSLKKISAEGTEVFNIDITPYMEMDKENFWLQYVSADKDSNLYLSNGNTYVWVFDKDGNHLADVELENTSAYRYINAFGILPDGRMAILQEGAQQAGLEIKIYNDKKKAFSDIYGGLPDDCWNTGFGTGINGGVLLRGNEGLYEYDLKTQTYTEILKWMDCDISPDYIDFATALPDGRIAAYSRDWSTNECSLIFLNKTPASEVVEKETLTLGCLGISQNLQQAVVKFNKNNDKYRIEIKDYMEVSSAGGNGMTAAMSADTYEDAINLFNNDVLTGMAPDMFTTSELNLEQLAAKGVIEDLSPYLEKSTVVNRDDLFESVLNAYTNAGVLCAIPSSFVVQTVFGRTAEVGEEPGWTMEDMIAYAAQYPDSEIFVHAERNSVLQYALLFNIESYVNWETGECSFDTPEFKSVLEFAAKYPETAEWAETEPKLLGSHEALLSLTFIDEPHSWQLCEAMFGEPITAIGFPSSTSSGVLVNGNESICISAASQNKEAAWTFIEDMLSAEAQENSFMRWGFPIRKDAFDKLMEESMEASYQYDENGEILLDENGEKVELSTRGYSWDDISFDLYSVKQDEVDNIKAVIDRIDGIVSYNMPLLSIVLEEAEPYFAGQKTVDEVADIIQSRVKIYVNESR